MISGIVRIVVCGKFKAADAAFFCIFDPRKWQFFEPYAMKLRQWKQIKILKVAEIQIFATTIK